MLDDYNTEKDQAFYSVIDTGSSVIWISALYYEDMILKMMEKVPEVEWQFEEGLVAAPCVADYPSIYFMFS